MRDNGVTLAIEAAGGITKLAEALGIKSPAVSQWTRVPVARVLDIERLYGIRREVLRPDIYSPESRVA